MAIATFEDLDVRFFRDIDEDHKPLVEARLQDAENKIRQRIPDLDERIEKNPALQDVVVTVCCDAVIRLIRNPEGYTQETDGNYTYMLAQTTADGKLTILPEEWADLGYRQGLRVIHTKLKLPWEYDDESTG